MVEGPGCKVKGENLNKRICNQKLIKIQSDDSKNTNKLGGDKTFQNSFESFVQSTVCEVRTLGKELFIFFKENALCIRVHFLMDGYIRINEAANVVGLKGSSKSAVLVIYLARDTVAIYNSHVDISISKEHTHVHRLYEDCLVRYNKLCQLDICSPEFDFSCANKLISSRPGKMVCDVIMDQDVLPGALFNSGINPNSTIGELTPDLVSRLVHRLRDFSAIFYKCRKQNKALSQYMKIYKNQRCGECGGRVTVCKPGELKRITYFCASCQTNSVTNLPSTGSLLGFVANSLFASPSLPAVPVCMGHKVTCTKKQVTKTSENQGRLFYVCSLPRLKQCHFFQWADLHHPMCAHKKVTVLRSVLKQNANNGRQFYCCPLPKQQQCDFFQ
uniref:DNA-(apurinic or apyrimidinic site) lyase n=1 Tax=Timema poppense TaxID=170557 RepID=A0A7R9CQR4_TIMPO|nr:unnamed protein product [Timema poppensis]